MLVHNAGVMGLSSSGPTIHDDPHFLTNHVVRTISQESAPLPYLTPRNRARRIHALPVATREFECTNAYTSGQRPSPVAHAP